MLTLKGLLNLIDNFYSENSLIKVFDVKKVSPESDCLADDIMGCVFGVCAGEAKSFLNSTYENAEIVSIYIGDERELRVLIDTHSDEDSDNEQDTSYDVQGTLYNRRKFSNDGHLNENNNA